MNEQANGKMITHATMTEDKSGEQHAIEVGIVPDGGEGSEVYVRPARAGEEGGDVWVPGWRNYSSKDRDFAHLPKGRNETGQGCVGGARGLESIRSAPESK